MTGQRRKPASAGERGDRGQGGVYTAPTFQRVRAFQRGPRRRSIIVGGGFRVSGALTSATRLYARCRPTWRGSDSCAHAGSEPDLWAGRARDGAPSRASRHTLRLPRVSMFIAIGEAPPRLGRSLSFCARKGRGRVCGAGGGHGFAQSPSCACSEAPRGSRLGTGQSPRAEARTSSFRSHRRPVVEPRQITCPTCWRWSARASRSRVTS